MDWFMRRLHAASGVRLRRRGVLLALGVEASDAGVDLRSLLLVDPPGRYPFGQSILVDAASPAFLQEVGVVVSAEQAQIANTALSVPSR
jgi:hypothetical protein